MTNPNTEYNEIDLKTSVDPDFVIDKEMAAYMLDAYRYPYQREISSHDVDRYVQMMETGQWLPKVSCIQVAEFGATKVLIDGQHRLMAVAKSGMKASFIFVEHKIAKIEDAAKIYAVLDSGKNRTVLDRFSALKPGGLGAIQKVQKTAFVAAIQVINNGFRVSSGRSSAHDLAVLSDKYQDALEKVAPLLMNKACKPLLNRCVLCVILEVVRLWPHEGIVWLEKLVAAVTNEKERRSLHVKDPIRYLAYRIQEGNLSTLTHPLGFSTPNTMIILATAAWNAYYTQQLIDDTFLSDGRFWQMRIADLKSKQV